MPWVEGVAALGHTVLGLGGLDLALGDLREVEVTGLEVG